MIINNIGTKYPSTSLVIDFCLEIRTPLEGYPSDHDSHLNRTESSFTPTNDLRSLISTTFFYEFFSSTGLKFKILMKLPESGSTLMA